MLVRAACGPNPAMTSDFEQLLFPPFQTVLAMDLQEFSPYVFQILAQLLEYRPDGLSDAYRALFQPLLAPANWDRKGNCPALVRLLQAYLKQGAAELLPHLQGILGCFQKLLALKSTEGNAFALLESVLVNVPMETLQPYLPQLFQLLMMRLQQNQTGRFCKLLVRFLCMFVVKHGPDGMVQCLEGVQAGMTNMIINQVWVTSLEASPPERTDAKVCVMGMVRLLSECEQVKADEAMWTSLLGCCIVVLAPACSGGGAEEEVVEEVVGFDGDAYCKLQFAAGVVTDPLPEVPDAGLAVAQTLSALCQSAPGVYSARLAKLAPEKQQALQEQCTRAGVGIV